MNTPLSRKVVVIGTGTVGSTYAYTLAVRGLAREIGLINRHHARAEGEAMDLHHGQPYIPAVDIHAGGYELCRDADLIVVTAGAAQEADQSRLELAGKNARIIADITRRIMEHADNPLILMVTNPVDVLTYVALKESGLAPERVFGSGTVLDSARFRSILSRRCGIDARSIHSHIIGEHGQSELAVWSRVNLAGIPLTEMCPVCANSCGHRERAEMLDDVRSAAFEVIDRKGATCYAIALAMARITAAVLGDEKSIHTVSSLVDGSYGIEGVCLSLPSAVGREGVEKVFHSELVQDELDALRHSAGVIRESIREVGY